MAFCQLAIVSSVFSQLFQMLITSVVSACFACMRAVALIVAWDWIVSNFIVPLYCSEDMVIQPHKAGMTTKRKSALITFLFIACSSFVIL